MGWMGTNGQLLHVLRTFRADTDDQGRFLIVGEMPATFLGIGGENSEVVVSDEVKCLIGGQEVSVAHLCNQTSYGVRNITVIGGG